MEHISVNANKKSNSVLFKHKTLKHIDESVELGLEITEVFKDALSRQANEAIRIYKRNESEILNNSKYGIPSETTAVSRTSLSKVLC